MHQNSTPWYSELYIGTGPHFMDTGGGQKRGNSVSSPAHRFPFIMQRYLFIYPRAYYDLLIYDNSAFVTAVTCRLMMVQHVSIYNMSFYDRPMRLIREKLCLYPSDLDKIKTKSMNMWRPQQPSD